MHLHIGNVVVVFVMSAIGCGNCRNVKDIHCPYSWQGFSHSVVEETAGLY